MPRILVAPLFAVCLFVPRWAGAQVLWMCALSDDLVRLICVADADPLHDAAAAPAPSAVINGTSFPLDPRRPYTVDLWSPPNEMDMVEQLARATICYRSPGCSVVVAERWATYAPPAARRLARAVHTLPAASGAQR